MKKTAGPGFWRIVCALAPFAILALLAVPALAQTLGQPYDGEISFQPAASPMKQQMIDFHDGTLMPIITGISVFVLFLLVFVMVRFNAKANPVPSKVTHHFWLEVVWTLVPVAILLCMVIPSMRLLYYVDRTHDADMTLNVTGYQWYWGYEYPDDGGINFFSNMVPEAKLKPGEPRLLKTDNPVVLPVDTNVRLIIKGADVIHSWSIPAFGVKLDAVPGRTNETWVRIDKEGTFYGQCSQLCGQNHAYMPIEVKAVSKAAFADWVHSQKGKMPDEIAAEKGAANAAMPDKGAAKPGDKAAKDKADKAKKEEKAGDK